MICMKMVQMKVIEIEKVKQFKIWGVNIKMVIFVVENWLKWEVG